MNTHFAPALQPRNLTAHTQPRFFDKQPSDSFFGTQLTKVSGYSPVSNKRESFFDEDCYGSYGPHQLNVLA